MKNTPRPKKSHFKAGLMAGALFGIAAGIYMSSKQGKQMAKQLQRQSTMIHKRLQSELKKRKTLTEDTYAETIDTVLAYYIKSKQIAKTELPALRRYLLGKWHLVKSEMREIQAGATGKRRT